MFGKTLLRMTVLLALLLSAVSTALANPPGPTISVVRVFVPAPGDGALAGKHWDSTITISDADGISDVADKYGFDGLTNPNIDLGVPASCPTTFTTPVLHNENPVRKVEASDCEGTPHRGYYRFFDHRFGPMEWTVPKANATVQTATGQNVRDAKPPNNPVGTGTFTPTPSGGGTTFKGAVEKDPGGNPSGPFGVVICIDPAGDLYCDEFQLSRPVPALSVTNLGVLVVSLLGSMYYARSRKRRRH